jgi:hypothetical protein
MNAGWRKTERKMVCGGRKPYSHMEVYQAQTVVTHGLPLEGGRENKKGQHSEMLGVQHHDQDAGAQHQLGPQQVSRGGE